MDTPSVSSARAASDPIPNIRRETVTAQQTEEWPLRPSSRGAPIGAWESAESAPKTGEHILVTAFKRGGFGICGEKWQDWCAVVHYWPVEGEQGFYLSNGASDPIDDRPIEFTHWMPLP